MVLRWEGWAGLFLLLVCMIPGGGRLFVFVVGWKPSAASLGIGRDTMAAAFMALGSNQGWHLGVVATFGQTGTLS